MAEGGRGKRERWRGRRWAGAQLGDGEQCQTKVPTLVEPSLKYLHYVTAPASTSSRATGDEPREQHSDFASHVARLSVSTAAHQVVISPPANTTVIGLDIASETHWLEEGKEAGPAASLSACKIRAASARKGSLHAIECP